jgi:cyclophilin family peptidyl-prolyl cis-trans isomerase
MLNRRTLLTAAATSTITGLTMSEAPEAVADTPSNILKLTLKYGDVTITLRPDLAPLAAERLRTLAGEGFYDGCKFFRVIAGFMAQTGDPSNTGSGGSPLPNLPAEFTTDASFLTGTLGMARTQDPNSANSQFFICFAPAPWLDGQYSIVGQVTAGIEAVQQIKKGAGSNGQVQDPDSIIKLIVV